MTNYNSSLKTWGAQGVDYPTGYDYLAGEQPVDAYDNNFNYNVIKDIEHLISLTNGRLDSGIGTAFPSSPTDGQVFYRSDTNRLSVYNAGTLAWEKLAKKSEVDTVSTNLSNHTADTTNPHSVTITQIGAAPDTHVTDTTNPHSVTAAQAGAVAKTGDSMSGTLNLSSGRVVLPVGLDKWA